MTPPGNVVNSNLIDLGRAFHEWRRDEGVLSARLLDIVRRAGELNEYDIYAATTFEKFSALNLSGNVNAVIRDLETIVENTQAVIEAIRKDGTVFSVIASMRDQVPPEAGDSEMPGDAE